MMMIPVIPISDLGETFLPQNCTITTSHTLKAALEAITLIVREPIVIGVRSRQDGRGAEANFVFAPTATETSNRAVSTRCQRLDAMCDTFARGVMDVG